MARNTLTPCYSCTVACSQEQYVVAAPSWDSVSSADHDTAQQWLNKPDGGKGWASYFLDQGYEVILVDITTVGRSTSRELPAIVPGATVEQAQVGLTAPELSNEYYQAKFHTQWPGVSLLTG